MLTWNEFFLGWRWSGPTCGRSRSGLALLRGPTRRRAVMAAAATIVSLPVIVLYVFFQRHFIRGMVSGALKE